MTGLMFFDLPVYRLTRAEHEVECQAYIRKVFPRGTLHGDLLHQQETSDPADYARKIDQTLNSFGNPWQFNEIVGYVRLHFVGTQVRGEYFGPKGTRVVRSRSRWRGIEFKSWKLAPEAEIDRPILAGTILAAVERYIAACRRELPRRHIDTEVFQSLAPHINWPSIFSAP